MNSQAEDASLGWWMVLKRSRFVNVDVGIIFKERNYVLVWLKVFLFTVLLN